MAEAHTITRAITGTDKTLTFETGKLAGQADGAVTVRLGDTVVLVTATGARSAREGADFFPLTVDIEERMYAAGKIPGSFFRREGKASDQAILTCRLIDRPLRPCFPDGLPQRGPRRRHHPRRRPGEPPRRRRHQRRLGRADAVGHPVRRPDRCRAHRLHHRRRVDPPPDLRRGRRVDLRARRRRAPARRRRRRHHDGRGRRHRGGLARLRGRRPQGDRRGHRGRASRRRSPRSATRSATSASSSRPPAASKPTMEYAVAGRLHAARSSPPSVRAGADRLAVSQKIADKAERCLAEAEVRDALIAELVDRFADYEDADEADQGGRPLDHQEDRAQPHRQRGRPHRRPRAWPTSGRCRPRSACSRPCTAPACSSGARPRCSTSPPSACPAWSRCSTRSASSTASATCTTTTSRRTPPVRPASCAARSAARSATACWPSGRSCPVLPVEGRVRLHDPPRLRRAVVQRLHLDGLGLRFDPVADGRRRADQGAGRRHRHGPRLRRGQVHDADRHPRCRGRVRRHGLQGRRHGRVRDRAAARHQDRRHPRRRAGPGARSRPRTPA